MTSIDQIPEALRDTFSSSVKSTNQRIAYNDWLTATREEADIQINDMPENVPYNVDMNSASSSDASADEASTGEDAQGSSSE